MTTLLTGFKGLTVAGVPGVPGLGKVAAAGVEGVKRGKFGRFKDAIGNKLRKASKHMFSGKQPGNPVSKVAPNLLATMKETGTRFPGVKPQVAPNLLATMKETGTRFPGPIPHVGGSKKVNVKNRKTIKHHKKVRSVKTHKKKKFGSKKK